MANSPEVEVEAEGAADPAIRGRRDGLDAPLHHRGLVAVPDIDGDELVPVAAPAVGAEAALVVVVQADVVLAGLHPIGRPHEGRVQVRQVVVALDAAVARRGNIILVRDREVPAVGGALEEEEVVARVDPYHISIIQ